MNFKVYIKFIVIICVLFSFSLNLNAQDAWQKTDNNLFSLDISILQNELVSVGKNENVFVEFPNTNGNLEAFEIKEHSVLPPALASKYPSIHTYIGHSLYNENLSINFTISGDTISATLMEGIETWDILNEAFTNNYYVIKPEENFSVKTNCRTTDTNSLNSSSSDTSNGEDLTSTNTQAKTLIGDNTLRTLRTAILPTTDYSAFFTRNLPSTASEDVRKSAVLGGIAASLNNVNAVFERDLGIHFELIENNDDLIFLNADDANTSLSSGAQIISNTIGDGNFDIGHILSGQFNGLAQVGVLCSSIKGQGISGSPTPQGSDFDFTLFAHELGHQLGANHTQNIQCQREGDFSSVETGVGTTIMGYTGVFCDGFPQIQDASDEYFHYVSIIQIRNHIQSRTCGIESNTVINANPVIINPPNYTIPVNTSFVLETAVSDADGDNLTYAWEQIDGEEAEMPPVSTSVFGPLFRSFPPTTSPQRFFPQVYNTNTLWEVLPTVEREMNFSLTVRDGNNGGVAHSTVAVNTVNTGQTFAVTSPINGLRLPQNSLQTIEWNVAGTDANGINVENVEIEISYDGGRSYEVLLESTPNDGTEIFTVPNTTISDQSRIRINAIGNIFYAVGTSNFNISPELDDDLSDFENPTGKILSIQVARLQVPQYTISIFDLRGAIVYEAILSSQSVELDVETLGRGFYIVKIVVGSQIYTEKIFKS